MADTKIEWSDKVWNPVAGCNDVSPGCTHCYARGMARRLEAMGTEKYKGLTVLQGSHVVWTGKIAFDENSLLQPLSWRKPKRVFVNSMSDLFHENVTDEIRDRIFAVMALCPQHTFQVLTKRPERMLAYLSVRDVPGRWMDEQIDMADWSMPSSAKTWKAVDRALRKVGSKESSGFDPRTGKESFVWMPKIDAFPLPNVWLGVSDEGNQHQRIEVVREVPAAVRFVSAEPLIYDPGPLNLTGIDWVIVGGESGHGARSLQIQWVRDIVAQCAAANTACFVKQMGQKPTCDPSADNDDSIWLPLMTGKAHDMDVWPEDLRVRQFPGGHVA